MRIPILWRLAPATLLRFPRTAVAVGFSAAVAVLATILGPLFLESSERAALSGELERTGVWSGGLQVVWRPIAYPRTESQRERHLRLGAEGRRAFDATAEDVPGIGSAVTTFLGGDSVATTPEGDSYVRLVHRTDALDHVEVVEEGGPGVWIADVTAEDLGIGPGDTISIQASDEPRPVRVGGVYRALVEAEPDDYWSPLTDFIHQSPGADTIPAPFVLGTADVVTGLDRRAQIRWNLPLESDHLSPQTIEGVAKAFRRIAEGTLTESGPIGKPLRELGGFALDPDVDSLLPGIVATAQDRLEASQAPAGVVTVAVRLLGAGLMVAAGLSLVARRRSEVRALIGRGASPASLAARFVVEGAAPVVAGGMAGVLAGYAGVRLLGASRAVEWGFVAGLAGDAALAAAGALVLLAVATGAAVLREERSFSLRRSGARRLLAPGAGVAVAAGGILAYRSLDEVAVESSTEALSGSILLAPIGLIAAASLAAGVLLRLALPFVAGWARRRSTAVFLAARRLAAGSGMTHTLVILCGSALGVMFFGVTVAGSVQHTATAKAKTFVGSDFSVGIGPNPPPLTGLGFPAAYVTKIETYLEGTSQPVTLLGVEPESFEEAAFWEDEFASEPLGDLLAGLDGGGSGAIPVVTAGFPSGVTPSLAGSELALEVTGRVRAFPGMTPERPLIAMTNESVIRAVRAGVGGTRAHLIWAKGDAEEIETALVASGQVVFQPLTAEEVLDTPTLQSLVWSLGLLGGAGALASATAIAGLSLYLQARHTAAQVAAAMTRRMGMPRRAELLSWTAEIGGAGVASFAVGAATGIVTALIVHERLDIQPELNPDPIFVVPAAILVATGVAVGLVSATTSRRLQRRMDRAPVGEIMRV